jgi:hypothetical protein
MSKTVRQFQCRDDLWSRVDALAKRRGISTDDVIQHALMQLFKSKKKEGEASAITPVPGTSGPAAAAPAARPAAAPAPARPATPAAAPSLPRPPGPPTPAARPAAPPPAAAPPASASSSGLGVAAAKAGGMAPKLPRPASAAPPTAAPAPTPAAAAPPPSLSPGVGGIPKPAPSRPRPQQPAAAATAAPAASRLPPPAAKPAAQQVRPLYLMFENQWYEVDKEEFVIGRGQKFSDLPIKDANISRRHCSIVRRGADYFIKDLGSTNGVEFEGTRVDNHKIVEGSVYFLCDHELRFSFTPPNAAS